MIRARCSSISQGACIVVGFALLLVLTTSSAVAQTIAVQNGGAISVENGGVWDLSGSTVDLGGTESMASISETGDGRFTGGQLTATRDLNAPSQTNPAGLGIEISSGESLGETTITRGHAVQTGGGNESIERFYDLAPTNNSGLDATLTFHYADEELNGLSESALEFFRSDDGGSTWSEEGQDGRDGSTNTVTLSGVDALSRWTLGSEEDPLPVELAGFEATRSEGRVRLQWETASEESNAGFEVQRRRADASEGAWKEVGFVESEAEGGTTSEAQSYRFADEDLPFEADSLTYRLRQVDTDGSATLSDPVVIEVGAPEELALHAPAPNPVRGQSSLRYEVPEQMRVQVEVYDVLGRKVRTLVDREEAGRERVSLDASGLSSGTYFVRLTAEGATQTEQITVVR